MRKWIFNWLLSTLTLEDLVYIIKRYMKRNEISELEIMDICKGKKVLKGNLICRLDKEV